MRRFVALAALVVVVLAGAAWAACSIYDPSLLAAGDDSGASDAADAEKGDAVSSDAADAGDAAQVTDGATDCALTHPPAAPAKDDPSDAGDLTLYLAMRTVDLGIRDDGGVPPPFGYDLDGLCTCPGPPDCVSAMTTCDQAGGIDNAGGALFRQFYQLGGGSLFSQDAVNSQIAAGQATLLLRIRQYNGTPNDTQVELALYVSDGTPVGDGGAPTPPSWDGKDVWTQDLDSLVVGTNPKYVDPNAYVSGGVLVGMPPHYVVPLPLDAYDLMNVDLSVGIVTGNLAKGANGWSIAGGILDGRWDASALLASLAYVHDPQNTNAYLCPSTNSYMGLKGLLCPALDITTGGAAPHTQTCDAISLGLGFTAEAAVFGNKTMSSTTTTCPDGGPDHC
jgi:hypothetical protein